MELLYYLALLIILLNIFPFLRINLNIFVISKIFNITLKIPGKGKHRIYYPGDSNNCKLNVIHPPDEVIINGISQDIINYTYYFNETENIVKLKYYSQEDVNNVAINRCFFYLCSEVNEIDLTEFDTSQFNNMFGMFSECFKLKSLKLSNFDTSNVIDMHLMFHRCESLTSIDLSTFDTKNVNNMDRIFYRCEAILSLDLSNFNISRVENIDRMFEGCISLTSLNLSNFDTSKMIKMNRTFYNCNNLEYLNLKNFKNELNVKNEDFYNTPENIVICTCSEPIINITNSKNCSLITCDDNWIEQQKKSIQKIMNV